MPKEIPPIYWPISRDLFFASFNFLILVNFFFAQSVTPNIFPINFCIVLESWEITVLKTRTIYANLSLRLEKINQFLFPYTTIKVHRF